MDKHVFITVTKTSVAFRTSTGESGSNPVTPDMILALMLRGFEDRGFTTEVRDDRKPAQPLGRRLPA